MKRIALLGLTSMVLTGCANHLYFGTGTSVGLDVSGTPASPVSASFAYKRTEVTFSKQHKDQEPYSVLGSLDSDVDFWAGTKIDQHFATGKASLAAAYKGIGKSDTDIATLLSSANVPGPVPCPDSQGTAVEDQKFLFVTGSAIGIDLDFITSANPHAVVGYKRTENAFIPVCKGNGTVGSVYSRMQFDSQADTGSHFFSNTGIKQTFATGKAAEIVAQKSNLGTEVVTKIEEVKPATQAITTK